MKHLIFVLFLFPLSTYALECLEFGQTLKTYKVFDKSITTGSQYVGSVITRPVVKSINNDAQVFLVEEDPENPLIDTSYASVDLLGKAAMHKNDENKCMIEFIQPIGNMNATVDLLEDTVTITLTDSITYILQ